MYYKTFPLVKQHHDASMERVSEFQINTITLVSNKKICLYFSLRLKVSEVYCWSQGLQDSSAIETDIKGGVRVFRRKKPHFYEFFSEIRMK